MKIHAKNDEEWYFLGILSEEEGRRRPKELAELNELGLGRAQHFIHAP